MTISSGALLVVLLAAAWLAADVGALWEGAGRLFGSPEALRGYVSGFGAWAPVAFFLAQVAQVILAPIPGVTTVVGPLLFGPWFGTALVLAGGMVGSVVLFAAGVRRWRFGSSGVEVSSGSRAPSATRRGRCCFS